MTQPSSLPVDLHVHVSRRRRLECQRKPRVTSRLDDALKATDSQLATRVENMAITSSFGDLGVVLNAPTNRRDGLITSSGITCIYMYLTWDYYTSF